MSKASFNLHVIFTNTDLTSIRTVLSSSLKATHIQGSSRALREAYTYHGCMPAPPGYRGSHSGLENYPSHASLMLVRCIDQQLSANTNGWPRNSFQLIWPRTLPFQWRPFMSDSRVRNFLLKWFSYILIPYAPSILVQIVKGFLGCVPFPRNVRSTGPVRTDLSQVKSQPLHDTDPSERQRAQRFKRTLNVYSSTPVVPELCIHVLSKHVIKGTVSQILTLEVTSHLQVHSCACGSRRVT